MNLKQLGILLIIVAVLGVGGLVYYRNQNASWSSSSAAIGKNVLEKFPVNDITGISIKQGTNELNLVKKDDLWRVQERNDYPANFSQISEFLLKVRDLKVVQSEQVGPSQLGRLNLVAGQGTNAATVVDFSGQGGKPIKTLLLGKPHMRQGGGGMSQFGDADGGWPDGRFVKAGDSQTVAVISDPLENAEPKPATWLNKDFIKIEKAKAIEVEFPVPANSWKLTRETESGEWKLADAKPGEQLDSAKTSSLSSPLSAPSFTDVSPGASLGGIGTNAPTAVKVDTFDNFSYTVKVGQKTNDDYPVTVAVTARISKERVPGKDEKPEEKAKLDKDFKDQQQKLEDKLKQEQGYEKWTYLVQSWSVDPLLKDRSQLLAEKKEEPKPETSAATNSVNQSEDSAKDAAKTPPMTEPKQ